MRIEQQIAAHYSHGGLINAIAKGLGELGLSPDTATVNDLSPVDEFHIGGRQASGHLLDQLNIQQNSKILDTGCGLGGGARFAAQTYGALVSGIDLTSEYIETGRVLCEWVGLADRVTLQQGSALSMPYTDGCFDCAYMMHVGMNIEAKDELFTEVHRTLAAGAKFGIYDIMRTNSADVMYPVPWAASIETSWLATPEDYKRALGNAGFDIVAENNRKDFALQFFAGIKEANATRGGPPALGLHTLMQNTTSEKVGNMIANIAEGAIAPVEVIAIKR